MKKIKFRYIDTVLNSKFGSLQQQSKKASLREKNGELFFVTKEDRTPIQQIVSVETYEAPGFQVDDWLKLQFIDHQANHREVYLTRRSFYHASVDKVKKNIHQMMKKTKNPA